MRKGPEFPFRPRPDYKRRTARPSVKASPSSRKTIFSFDMSSVFRLQTAEETHFKVFGSSFRTVPGKPSSDSHPVLELGVLEDHLLLESEIRAFAGLLGAEIHGMGDPDVGIGQTHCIEIGAFVV